VWKLIDEAVAALGANGGLILSAFAFHGRTPHESLMFFIEA